MLRPMASQNTDWHRASLNLYWLMRDTGKIKTEIPVFKCMHDKVLKPI